MVQTPFSLKEKFLLVIYILLREKRRTSSSYNTALLSELFGCRGTYSAVDIIRYIIDNRVKRS